MNAHHFRSGTATKVPFGQRIRDWWNGLSRFHQWAIIIPVVVLVYLMPFLNFFPITTEPGTDFELALFNTARIVLIAIGLNVVVGQAGLLDLGYVGFFAIGAYVAALMTSRDSALYAEYPWLLVVVVGIAVTMVSGVIIGTPTLRLRGDYLAIVTLGFGEIVRLLADNIPALRGNVGFRNLERPPGEWSDGTRIFTQGDGIPWYWLTVTAIIAVLILVGNLERSRVGRAWVAIREDEDAAEIMGVPTFRFKVWAFVIGAAIGGLSGVLYAGQLGFVNNARFDVVTSVLFLAAVILGGSGNKVGVILGAIVIAYTPERFQVVSEYRYLIFGLALIVLMIFRPQGLLGARQRLLARGRQAYKRLVGKPEPVSTESPMKDAGKRTGV
ncbi:branched-chain amino acid ABC transporter permease [Actinoalloteichus spitiensis]|uniref:branched-chain amino acid ABC transporter permease n=1 Tax=Actinoalloteichus spitiensis TaxID=252394 RepID=UPI0002F70B24|nr:branched-chain amino acid ABC transporter permease [Actinoalloteichus spitiensis]